MKLHARLAKLLKGAYEIYAPAKINWALDIVGQRADGYHLLDSLMQSLELSDRLYIEPAEELSLTIDENPDLVPDDKNLVLRAARALQQYAHVDTGAHITLEKRIPMGAGLGGGSADAAATLKALDEIWDLGLSAEECAMVGNDVDEDMVAEELGMQVFLITDCLLNRHGKDISAYNRGGFADLIEFLGI